MRFSVIVPVYRTQAYLDRCVQSVLTQSHQDLELILVEDCSGDDCGRLCDEYAALDPRVRVIHKPVNEGLGFARNTGLEAARGDFILFLDSDDWIDPGLLKTCEPFLDGDILVFGTTFVHENTAGAAVRQEVRLPQQATANTSKEIADVFAMLTRARIFSFAWNRLYRRQFLLDCGVRFEQTKLIEDLLFNIALLPKAGCVRCLDKALHFYRKPAHETLASKYSPDFFALSKRKYLLEEQFLMDSDAPEHLQLIYLGFVKHLLSAALRNASTAAGLSRKEQKQALRSMLRDSLTQRVIVRYQPENIAYRLIRHLVRRKRTGLLLAICTGLSQRQK